MNSGSPSGYTLLGSTRRWPRDPLGWNARTTAFISWYSSTHAVQAAISYQVSVTMVDAWDQTMRRYATMALVQGQPGCQDALQELLRGSRA
eukprot:11269-Heterocapsa_arctica.AAC.1